MPKVTSFEYLAELTARRPRKPAILEAWKGTQVVAWYGSIERQLSSLQREAVAAENKDAEAKLQAFLRTWRDNELTGAVNVETVNALKAGAEVLAVDRWNLSNYFSQLRDQLRKLKASLEELPMDGFDAEAANSFGPGPGPRSLPMRLEPPVAGDGALEPDEAAAEEPAEDTAEPTAAETVPATEPETAAEEPPR
jgi:hypothetical protein